MKLPSFSFAHFSSTSFIAGIIAGVLVSGAWVASTSGGITIFRDALNLSTSTPSRAEASASDLISVPDQPAGNSAIVTSVSVPETVWVAVREVNGQNLGNVLGAVRVTGPKSGITVPLLRGTISGRTYAVELYRDDADGVFDPARFSVYVDFDSGARVVSYFATTFDYHGS